MCICQQMSLYCTYTSLPEARVVVSYIDVVFVTLLLVLYYWCYAN